MIDDLLSILPNWLNFILQFPRDPNAALAAHIGKGAVSKELTTHAVAGAAVAYLLAKTIGGPQAIQDTGRIATLLRGIEPAHLPPFLLVAAVGVALLVHPLILWAYRTAAESEPGALRHTVHDTVNAMFGGAALLLPCITLLTLTAASAMALGTRAGLYAGLGLSIALGLALPFILARVLGAAHPAIGTMRAFVAVSLGLTTFSVVAARIGQALTRG